MVYMDMNEVKRTIAVLYSGMFFEIRIIGLNNSGYHVMKSGYFRDPDALINHMCELTDVDYCNVYITLNQLDDACFGRVQRNKFLNKVETTKDVDVVRYKSILIDIDPTRPQGTSSTDKQIEDAKKTQVNIRNYLKEMGFPDPVEAFSGNGYHLRYDVDFPNTTENVKMVSDFLKALDAQFSTETEKVDISVFNPSRICKLYGTIARKGSPNDPDRPHRMSKIIAVPEVREVVSVDLIKSVINEGKPEDIEEEPVRVQPKTTITQASSRSVEDMEKWIEDWLDKHEIEYSKKDGSPIKYTLAECPFDASHKQSAILVYESGKIGFHCFHNSCAGKGWRDVRNFYEPDLNTDKGRHYEVRTLVTDEENKEIIDQIVKELKSLNAIEYDWGDKGSGKLFAEIFGGTHRFNPDANKYMWYDGVKWCFDAKDLYAKKCVKLLVDGMRVYCKDLPKSAKDTYGRYVAKLVSYNSRANILKDAQDERFISYDDLDCQPYLLNCSNGTLDLSGDEPVLNPHNPEDLLSKATNVDYDPDAKCNLWEKVLFDVMEGNEAKIQYIKKIFGYSLFAGNPEAKMFIFYGKTTRNGKSTVIDTFKHIMGDYGDNIQPNSLSQQTRSGGSASSDIARLEGVRFLNCAEPPKGLILDAALLKQMTGGDTITARKLYESEHNFVGEFTLVMNTNHLPLVLDNTLFTSNRVQLVEFNRHFEEHEQDKNLRDKLLDPDEMSGILNWCIEGYYEYKRQGLYPPKEVVSAVKQYEHDSDKLTLFFEDCMAKEQGYILPVNKLYPIYTEWCSNNRMGAEGKKAFMEILKERGYYNSQGRYNGHTVRNVVNGYKPLQNIEENLFM